jgi:RNase P protein component
MMMELATIGSKEAQEFDKVVCVRLQFHEMDKSNFEKTNSKGFKKKPELRLGVDGEGGDYTIYGRR